MLYAVPPTLLSSVDLISGADDPFSSRPEEAAGRDGRSQSGPARWQRVRARRVTAVEKPVLAA